VTRPGAPIVHPDGIDQLDYEVELAVVIGRTARSVDAEEALAHVAGYTVRAGELHPLPVALQKHVDLRRDPHFAITFDRDFEGVMRGCAETRPGRAPLTWITPRMMAAYRALHEAGYAHSVEVRDGQGALVGGIYGVSIGGVFFTESQFNRVRDAAKAGFAVLNRHLAHWGYLLNDGKMFTPHLARVGFTPIPRARFNALLTEGVALPGRTGPWAIDETLDVGNWEPGSDAAPGPV
jgi:leucyl/phenylalanyl-tRNA--protein transferase